MRTYSSHDQFDVWKIRVPVKVECAAATMYFAPCQNWTMEARKELERDGVYLKRNMAVRRIGERYALGYEDDGCVSFVKNDPGIIPEYRTEYRRQDIQDLIEILKKMVL